MGNRKNKNKKKKRRKEKEAMIFRRGKQKRKRLRGGKMKNRCTKENKKEYGMQKTNSEFKKRQETKK